MAVLALVTTEPDAALMVFRLVTLYAVVRMVMIFFFYGVGLYRWRRQERRARTATPTPDALGVHHVVLVPNYREPVELLARTLAGLAVQQGARQWLSVVLAMEAKDKDASLRAQQLQHRFADSFAHFLVTYHPAGLPGETPGKSSNQRWAAREARRVLVEQNGLPLERMTLTSCDADSVIHPDYFAELTRQFNADPGRNYRIWHAPMRFHNNFWQIPSSIRVVTLFTNVFQLSEMSSPLAINFPLSTYSLSFALADAVHYWDPGVISEDQQMFLRSLFATNGRVRFKVIYLPTTGDAVTGATTWEAMTNFYRQHFRHMWGSEGIGYVVQQRQRWSSLPPWRLASAMINLLDDHVFFATVPAIMAAAAILTPFLTDERVVGLSMPSLLFTRMYWLNGLVVLATCVAAVYEHLRTRHQVSGWRFWLIPGDIVAWIFLPVLTFLLIVFPALHAQTQMLFGYSLSYAVTPKKLDTNIAN